MTAKRNIATSQKKIVIHLDGATSHGKDEQIIQHVLLDRMVEQITRDVTVLNVQNQESGDYRSEESRNLCYMVKGARGSGKSFFIHNLVKALTSVRDSAKISLLTQCDPSLMNASNHFLLSVVAAVNSRLDNLENSACSKKIRHAIATCRSKVIELTSGIARLANPSEYRKRIDRFQIAELRENDNEFPGQMQQTFDEVMKYLCDIFESDAMLITIDDADVYTEQCMDVLESIRLCLACPHCIVVLSGDYQIYSERVREHYFKQFDECFHKSDKAGKSQRDTSITGQAAQYLIKLFPVNRQFLIKKLHDFVNENEIHIQLDGGVQLEIRELYAKILSITFGGNQQDYKSHIALLLALPLRTQINIIKKISEKIDFTGENPSPDTYDVCRTFCDLLQNTLYVSTEAYASDFNDGWGYAYYSMLLQYCNNVDDILQGCTLSHLYDSSSDNNYIGLLLASYAKCMYGNLADCVSHIFYGPATISLFAYYSDLKMREPKRGVRPAKADCYNQFTEYLHTGGWNNPSSWAKRMTMVLSQAPDDRKISNGILIVDDNETVENIKSKVLRPHEEYVGHGNAVQMIALAASIYKPNHSDGLFYISPYGIFGLLLGCIQTIARSDIGKYKKKEKSKSPANQTTVKRIKEKLYGDTVKAGLSLTSPAEQSGHVTDLVNWCKDANTEHFINSLTSVVGSLKESMRMFIYPKSESIPAWLQPKEDDESIHQLAEEINHEFSINSSAYDDCLISVALDIITWYFDSTGKQIRYENISPCALTEGWIGSYMHAYSLGAISKSVAKTAESHFHSPLKQYARAAKDIVPPLQENRGTDAYEIFQAINDFPLCKAFTEVFKGISDDSSSKNAPSC